MVFKRCIRVLMLTAMLSCMMVVTALAANRTIANKLESPVKLVVALSVLIQINADIIAAVQEIIACTVRGTALIDILRKHRQILADLRQLLLNAIMDAHILSLDEGIDIENHIRALHRCRLQMEGCVVVVESSREQDRT